MSTDAPTLEQFEARGGAPRKPKTGATSWLRALPYRQPTAIPPKFVPQDGRVMWANNLRRLTTPIAGTFRFRKMEGGYFVVRYPIVDES